MIVVSNLTGQFNEDADVVGKMVSDSAELGSLPARYSWQRNQEDHSQRRSWKDAGLARHDPIQR